jgi:hypothetical protein
LKKHKRSQNKKKSVIKRKLEKDLCNFVEGNKDADESMDSLRWREMITEFQKKSVHSSMNKLLGGIQP